MLSNFACSFLLESTEVSAVPAEVVDAVTNYSSCSVQVVFLHVSVRLWRPRSSPSTSARFDFCIQPGLGTCGHDASQQFGERLLAHIANGRLHVSISVSSRDWGPVAMTLPNSLASDCLHILQMNGCTFRLRHPAGIEDLWPRHFPSDSS